MAASLSVLLIDDEPDVREMIRESLAAGGHSLTTAADAAEAGRHLASTLFDLVVCDVHLPRGDGMTLFRQIRQRSPETDVILMTGYGAVTEAVAALKEGAHDYLTKPLDLDELALRVDRIARHRATQRELAEARARLSQRDEGPTIIGHSPAMLRLLDRVNTIAASDAAVLITGESGTGKELVARTLHERSARRLRPFLAVSCAAFPETLIEAELFGHERGAFTGAVGRRDGRFKAADGGTLLLDEIAELPLSAQAKLLRVLQEGTVEPLGSNTVVRVDVRVLSATHRNLRQRIADGLFREDLFYRLMVLDVEIPPLRERHGNLPLLLQHFLRVFTPTGESTPSIAPRALAALSQHPFAGNVRELAHAVEHAVVLARGRPAIDLEHLPGEIAGAAFAAAAGGPAPSDELQPLAAAIKEFEREYLRRALELSGGRRARAAALLGISRKNLWEKMRAHGMRDDDEK